MIAEKFPANQTSTTTLIQEVFSNVRVKRVGAKRVLFLVREKRSSGARS
jgi:hypothetical protein